MARVLIVDDDLSVVNLLVEFLRKRGDAVEGFKDPFRALVSALDDPPDLVIVDQFMPMMEGTRLIGEMSKAGIHARFFLMSGRSALESLPSVKNSPIDCFLRKPFHLAELSLQLDRAEATAHH